MAGPKYFMVYFDCKQHIDMLSDQQAGMLFKALFEFAVSGEIPEFSDGMVKMAFSFLSAQIGRDLLSYNEKCERNRINALKRWEKNTNECDRIQPNATLCQTCQEKEEEKEKEEKKEKEEEKDKEKTSLSDKSDHTPKSSKSKKRKFGEYGHVRLTDEEYQRLCDDYGQETVDTYIAKCDEYCEIKPKTYGNYNLAIRNWLNRDNIRKRGDNSESSPVYRSTDPNDEPF
ncbi:MAG: hypothetical protein K2L10_03055 [Ruminococcus sp.]|nr:hypothetical protein [Ruminococcus sp.]